MPSRAERRRQTRGPYKRPSFLVNREVLAGFVLGVAVVAAAGAVVLFSGGEDGGPSVTSTPRPEYSPASEEEAAIAALARRSIEVMPRNQWPSLYDDFTAEFQSRCSREEFIQSGIEAAQEQGANLARLGFVRLEDVSVQNDAATATIIGEVTGSFEYEVLAAFQRESGTWKLAPPEGTSGCQAFNRP
jgi:hypothetical protein